MSVVDSDRLPAGIIQVWTGAMDLLRELLLYRVLGRWDEKADPLRSTLWVCKGLGALTPTMEGGSAHHGW